MLLLTIESLLSSDLLVILVAALIFFGPRRLPQISRQLGKSLAEFRRASEDFKRTWEREVALENLEKGVAEQADDDSILNKAADRIRAVREAAARDEVDQAMIGPAAAPSVTPVELAEPRSPTVPQEPRPAPPAPLTKHEWL